MVYCPMDFGATKYMVSALIEYRYCLQKSVNWPVLFYIKLTTFGGDSLQLFINLLIQNIFSKKL